MGKRRKYEITGKKILRQNIIICQDLQKQENSQGGTYWIESSPMHKDTVIVYVREWFGS